MYSASTNCDSGISTGANSGKAGITGIYTTAIGFSAGSSHTSGVNSLYLGASSDTTAPTSGNQICLGPGAISDGANQCVIGDGAIIEIRPHSNNLCNLGRPTKSFKNVYANEYYKNGVVLNVGTQVSYTGFKVKQGTDSNVITLDVFKTNNKISISFPELTVPSVSANTDPIISLNMNLTNLLQPAGLYTFPVIINNKSAYVKFTYDTPNTTWYLSFINYVAWDAGTNVIQPFTITYTCLNNTTPANTVWGTVYPSLITNLITPTLTGNTSNPNFLVSASSEFSAGDAAWHAFDGIVSSWISVNTAYDGAGNATGSGNDKFISSLGLSNGAYIKITLNQQYKFNYYKLGQNAGTGSVPTDFRLYGSNSAADNTYVLIDTRTAYDAHGTPDNPIVFKPNISVGTQQYQYLVFQV